MTVTPLTPTSDCHALQIFGLYLLELRPAHVVEPVDLARAAAEERIVAICLAVMASFGLAGDDALHAVRALRSTVHGFTTLEAAGGFGLPLDLDESFRRLVEMLAQAFLAPATMGVPHVEA